jgi:hypothetical protein
MKRRAVLAAISLRVISSQAAGLGAGEYSYLDGMQVDPKTGIVTLLLLINRPLEDGLTKPKVRSKMLAYHRWVFIDRKLVQQIPKAQPERGVRLIILHPNAKNALGRSVLEQLVGYAKELGFEPSAQLLVPGN